LDDEVQLVYAVTVTVDDPSIGSMAEDAVNLSLVITDVDDSSGISVSIPPRQPMTPDERVVAIEKFVAEIDAILPDINTPPAQRYLTLGAEVEAVAMRLAQLPEVLAVLYDNEVTMSATIVMADGFPVQFINNRPPDSTAPVLDSRRISAALATSKTASLAAAEVPGSKKAVLASYGGGAHIANDMATRVANEGYEVLNLGASIEDMALYKDLGFLLIDSHGGGYISVTPIRDAAGNVISARYATDVSGNLLSSYTIQSSTKMHAGQLAEFGPLLDDGQLAVTISQVAISSGQASATLSIATLGITDKFIQNNWSLDNGVAIMHTCYGGASSFNHGYRCAGNGCPPAARSGTLSAVPVRQAIMGAGANVLMSFSNLTWPDSAAPSMYFFVDRLLGANVEQAPSPETRPFESDAVKSEMGRRGLLQFWNGNASNDVVIESMGNPGLLAPSIKHMDLVDNDDTSGSRLPGQLTLNGDFGTEQGTVELDGAPLNIRSWAADKIEADVPYVAPGAGPVIVKSKPGIESNPVPLTEWFGTFTLEQTFDGLTARIDVDVQFRADLHKFRETTDGNPQERIVTSIISPETSGRTVGSGSFTSGSVTVINGGNYPIESIFGKTAIDNLGNVSAATTKMAQTAAIADVVTLSGVADGVSEFAASFELDPANDRAEMCFWLLGFYDVTTNGTTALKSGVLVAGANIADRTKGVLACVTMTLQDDYVISAGQRSAAGGITLKWSQFMPVSPPTADTRS
jgi:hypothetical protein